MQFNEPFDGHLEEEEDKAQHGTKRSEGFCIRVANKVQVRTLQANITFIGCMRKTLSKLFHEIKGAKRPGYRLFSGPAKPFLCGLNNIYLKFDVTFN